jgi:hypothetical protein
LWFKSKLDIEEDAASMTRQAQLFSTDKVLVAVIAGKVLDVSNTQLPLLLRANR